MFSFRNDVTATGVALSWKPADRCWRCHCLIRLSLLPLVPGQINGKVKLLTGGGKAEDVKPGVEQDPEAEIAIACPLCGAMFNLRTGDPLVGDGAICQLLFGEFLSLFVSSHLPLRPVCSPFGLYVFGVLVWVAQDEGHTWGGFSVLLPHLPCAVPLFR